MPQTTVSTGYTKSPNGAMGPGGGGDQGAGAPGPPGVHKTGGPVSVEQGAGLKRHLGNVVFFVCFFGRHGST